MLHNFFNAHRVFGVSGTVLATPVSPSHTLVIISHPCM